MSNLLKYYTIILFNINFAGSWRQQKCCTNLRPERTTLVGVRENKYDWRSVLIIGNRLFSSWIIVCRWWVRYDDSNFIVSHILLLLYFCFILLYFCGLLFWLFWRFTLSLCYFCCCFWVCFVLLLTQHLFGFCYVFFWCVYSINWCFFVLFTLRFFALETVTPQILLRGLFPLPSNVFFTVRSPSHQILFARSIPPPIKHFLCGPFSLPPNYFLRGPCPLPPILFARSVPPSLM